MKYRVKKHWSWRSSVLAILRRDSSSGDVQLISLPRHMDRLLNGLYRKYLLLPSPLGSSTNRNSSGVEPLHPWYLCKQNWLCKTVIYKVFKQIEMEMLSLLGRLSPKGLGLSQASGIFINFFFQVQVHDRVGSAVGFHLLKYMKGQGNVSFWSVKRPKGC